MDARFPISSPLRLLATSYRPDRGLVDAAPGAPVPPEAVAVRVEGEPEGGAALSIECRDAAGKPAALLVRLGPEAAEGLGGTLLRGSGGALAWEARFNGGNGGATIRLGGRSAFVTGSRARELAEALDPGRTSRPFAAEVDRIAAELRALAGRLGTCRGWKELNPLAVAASLGEIAGRLAPEGGR